MSDINRDLLTAIKNATAVNSVVYVSQAEGLPLVRHTPPLIVVDTNQKDPSDSTKVAAQITEEGIAYLGTAETGSTDGAKPVFEVETGFVRPKMKRGGGGGGGAPTKYPFETMEAGTIFFVANTEVSKGDAHKTMGSAVGSANQRFAEDTAEMHEVKRAQRSADGKVIKGGDGKAVMETVTVPKKRQLKHFAVSKVEAGKVYGSWTAPADGAVVLRTA